MLFLFLFYVVLSLYVCFVALFHFVKHFAHERCYINKVTYLFTHLMSLTKCVYLERNDQTHCQFAESC